MLGEGNWGQGVVLFCLFVFFFFGGVLWLGELGGEMPLCPCWHHYYGIIEWGMFVGCWFHTWFQLKGKLNQIHVVCGSALIYAQSRLPFHVTNEKVVKFHAMVTVCNVHMLFLWNSVMHVSIQTTTATYVIYTIYEIMFNSHLEMTHPTMAI